MQYLLLVVLVYLVTVIVYLITGYILTVLGKKMPQRRIQNNFPGQSTSELIKRSLKSLIIVAFCTGTGIYVQLQGWGVSPYPLSISNFVLMFILGLVMNDAWFYFSHRTLHTKKLFFIHKRHHECRTPSTWSNDYFDLFDAFTQHVYFLFIPFLLPIPIESLIALRLYDQVKGMIGHSGFEFLANRYTRYPYPFVSVHFHDDHHSKFHYNFSNSFTIWDRLFGTIDPEYDRRIETFEAIKNNR